MSMYVFRSLYSMTFRLKLHNFKTNSRISSWLYLGHIACLEILIENGSRVDCRDKKVQSDITKITKEILCEVLSPDTLEYVLC